jgi:hypothetical protein
MNELENINSSKVFYLHDRYLAEAFLEYRKDVPFINIFVDSSFDIYMRLRRKSDTLTIYKNLNRGLVESMTNHGFACNDSGAVQFRLHLN